MDWNCDSDVRGESLSTLQHNLHKLPIPLSPFVLLCGVFICYFPFHIIILVGGLLYIIIVENYSTQGAGGECKVSLFLFFSPREILMSIRISDHATIGNLVMVVT